MDNKETAEHFRSRSSEVPLWHRQNISVGTQDLEETRYILSRRKMTVTLY